MRGKHPGTEEEYVEVQLLCEGNILGVPYVHDSLTPQLHRTARPPVLLLAVGAVLRGYLVETRDIIQEYEPPPAQIRPKGEVHVLDRGSAVPTARVHDALAPPHPRGAIEVEEETRRVPRVLLAPDVVV